MEEITWGNIDRQFNVLCSIDESIRCAKDINYSLYLVLKSLTEYESLESDYDIVNMKLYTLREIGQMVKGARGFLSDDTVGKQLQAMENKGIINIEKIGKKYDRILIPKIATGEKGIMLNNKVISNLSSVLKPDAMKVYIYLLNWQEQRVRCGYTNEPVISAEAIFRGAFGKEPKTSSDVDLKKIYTIMGGLDTITLIDKEISLIDKEVKTRRNPEGKFSKIYKINKVRVPKQPSN